MSEVNQENRDKKYNEWARRNPAIISIVFPLLVAVYFFQEYYDELSDVRYIVGAILSFGSIIPALFFFYQSSIREFSILFVERPLFWVFGRPSSNLMKKKKLQQMKQQRLLKFFLQALQTCCLQKLLKFRLWLIIFFQLMNWTLTVRQSMT